MALSGLTAGGLVNIPLLGASSAMAQTGGGRGLLLGVNFAGAEFNAIGGRWHWPKLDNLQYYLGKGFRIFRIPFLWERLQPQLHGELDNDALSGLETILGMLEQAGAIALLDAHNYGRRQGQIIGDPGSPVDIGAFADFWGRMGARYRSRRLVWYNLMNEPHSQDPQTNLMAQNAACRAIRAAGATTKVLFSGIAWTGGHSWISSGNGQVMLGARDPANNYAFDVHQYLDKGFGGSSEIAIPGVGAHILTAVYQWASANGKKIFLGEFGTGPSPASVAELHAMIDFMAAHQDVFIGGTMFAGGGTWGRNPKSADPIDGVDKPQTMLLRQYFNR